MKKFVVIMGLSLLVVSCGNNSNTENPSAIDTTQHPTGITNSNVISTDTAAMKVDSTQK